MKPWFEKESNVIKFPTPKAKVVQMPNVQSYPDFLTGVKDLHTRVARGEISQQSHDKLYQDLIHRFMKKESFETPWFLREAPADQGIMSLPQAQKIKALSKQVASLPKDVSDRILDQINSALQLAGTPDKSIKGKTSKKQNQYLKVSRAVKAVDDGDLQKYYKVVSKFMLGNSLTSEEITKIIKAINDNTCISVDELQKPSNVLSNIIRKDLQTSDELKFYWNDMLTYQPAQGIGPGEILFATHSKELRKGEKGDLVVIDDNTPIEVKGGAYKGRFKDDDINPSPDYFNKATKFINDYQQIIPKKKSGIAYSTLLGAIHSQDVDKKIRQKMLDDFTLIIEDLWPNNEYTPKIIQAVKSNNLKQAQNFHGLANLKAYFTQKQAEGGMGLLFISRRGGVTKTSYAENIESLVKGFNLTVNTAYPISAVERNPFAQMSAEAK